MKPFPVPDDGRERCSSRISTLADRILASNLADRNYRYVCSRQDLPLMKARRTDVNLRCIEDPSRLVPCDTSHGVRRIAVEMIQSMNEVCLHDRIGPLYIPTYTTSIERWISSVISKLICQHPPSRAVELQFCMSCCDIEL